MTKTTFITAIALITISAIALPSFTFKKETRKKHFSTYRSIPKGCVFRTLMGEETSDSSFRYKTPEKTSLSMTKGLNWIVTAQNQDGGWGAGSHSRQDVIDPHAVPSDPATTSMVAMALLRSGTTLKSGMYSQQLRRALNYLLNAVETSSASSLNITNQVGTQIQMKLGQNIDVILTSQFLSNILDYVNHDAELNVRVKKDLNTCVTKIQRAQDSNGSTQGSGWAGVLQSSFASNALELLRRRVQP